MINFASIIKGLAVTANCFFFINVFYGRKIYNKKFNGRVVHRLTVALVISMAIYLLAVSFYMVNFILGKYYIKSAGCLFFIISPFTVGLFGNNYDNAKAYFNIQLLFLLLSLIFLILFV